MASPQIQFRALSPLNTHLTDRAKGSALSPADVARRDLNRYYTFLAAALNTITLTEGEALLLCDALNGTYVGEGHDCAILIAHLHHEIADTAPDGLGQKWGVDLPTLVAKIEGWTPQQRLAVVDAVERWWATEIVPVDAADGTRSDSDDYADRLRFVGLLKPAREELA